MKKSLKLRLQIDGEGKINGKSVRWGGTAEYEIKDGRRQFVRMINGCRIECGKLIHYKDGESVSQ